METAFVIIVLSIIASVTYTINRKGKQEAVSIEETQPMPVVLEMSPYDTVMLNAAKHLWQMASVVDEHGVCQWYVVDRQTGQRVFEVDEQTHTVKRVAQKPVQRKRRATARTN